MAFIERSAIGAGGIGCRRVRLAARGICRSADDGLGWRRRRRRRWRWRLVHGYHVAWGDRGEGQARRPWRCTRRECVRRRKGGVVEGRAATAQRSGLPGESEAQHEWGTRGGSGLVLRRCLRRAGRLAAREERPDALILWRAAPEK